MYGTSVIMQYNLVPVYENKEDNGRLLKRFGLQNNIISCVEWNAELNYTTITLGVQRSLSGEPVRMKLKQASHLSCNAYTR